MFSLFFLRFQKKSELFSGIGSERLRNPSGASPALLRRFSGAAPALLRRFSGASPAQFGPLAASFSENVKKTWNSMKKTVLFSKRVFFLKSIGSGTYPALFAFFFFFCWIGTGHPPRFDSTPLRSTAVRTGIGTRAWTWVTRIAVFFLIVTINITTTHHFHIYIYRERER